MDTAINLRIDRETMEQLQFCMDRLDITRSAVLRKGVRDIYDRLKSP